MGIRKIEIREADSPFEAAAFIFSGAYYFLIGQKGSRKWVAVGWTAVVALFFSVGKPALENYLTDRLHISIAEPEQEHDGTKVLSPAGTMYLYPRDVGEGHKGQPILFAGKVWGHADTSFAAFKLMDKEAILVYDKTRTDLPPLIYGIEGIDKYRQGK